MRKELGTVTILSHTATRYLYEAFDLKGIHFTQTVADRSPELPPLASK